MDNRLVNLEEKVTHLERHLGELDAVVRELHDNMDRYQRQIDQIKTLVESSHDSSNNTGADPPSDTDLTDDKPPHW
ncbi:MAG: SlyX family protein [Planctomycetota bacterium]